MSTYYIIQTSDNKVLAESITRTLPLNDAYISEGDEILIFPILETRKNIETDGEYAWVVENIEKLQLWEALNKEQLILKDEIMSEDYSTGTIPQLRKLARLRQLELILASGNF